MLYVIPSHSEIRQMREDAELEVANTKVLDQGTALAQLKAMVAKIGAKLADGPGASSSLPHWFHFASASVRASRVLMFGSLALIGRGVVVTKILADPAAKSGLQPGDLVCSIRFRCAICQACG